MNQNIYKQILDQSSFGYAYHKIILDDMGNPIDYQFLETNAAFEKLTGLQSKETTGKKITEILPEIKNSQFDWISLYGKIAINGGEEEFEQYSEALKKWYKVKVYSTQKEYFITTFTDITKEHQQIQNLYQMTILSEELLQGKIDHNYYQKITDNLLEITQAKFASFNLYDLDGKNYTTIALSGNKQITKEVNKILGIRLENKKWPHDEIRAKKIKDKIITRFSHLHELTGEVIPKPICDLLTKSFGIGETIVVKIMKNNLMLGDFTLIMPNDIKFEKDNITEIFANQVGLALVNIQEEEKIQQSEEQYRLLTTKMQLGLALHEIICDDSGKPTDYRFISINDSYQKITGLKRDKILGKTIMEILPDTEKHWIELFGKVALTGKENRFEYYSPKLKRYFSTVAYSPKKGQFALIVDDITERNKYLDEITYLSFHDHLTGLYNRGFLETELTRLDTKRNLPLSIIMGDLNGLKLINDTFGHKVGDELLKKVAMIFKNTCRNDDIIARLGGDEFALILPKTGEAEAQKLIDRILAAAKEQKVKNIDISISFGLATKTDMTQNKDMITKKAEDKMYNNKLFDGSNYRGKVIDNVIQVVNKKSPREEAHSKRVADLCVAMGKELGMTEVEINTLRQFGLLHDIGKIAIADEILNKPDQLSEREYFEIKRHSEVGFRILSTVNEMLDIANYVLYHHERWDGKGYPKGIEKDNIPLPSRICTIADAYEAMTSDRSYRPAMTHEYAIEELSKNKGTQFDPILVDIFINKVLIY